MKWTEATKAVFCLMVFLQLSCHHWLVNAARLPRSVDQNLAITASKKLVLFIDGIENKDLHFANAAPQADIVFLPASTQLVAVNGKNNGQNGGFLGSAETFVTDSSWKCTDIFYEGWHGVAFNDSRWDEAYVVGHNGINPPYEVDGISANASWIWVQQEGNPSTHEKDVYCRKTLESRGSFAEPKTSLLFMLLAFLLLKN